MSWGQEFVTNVARVLISELGIQPPIFFSKVMQ